MKLIDFYSFEPLNNLKQRMGISVSIVGNLTVEVHPGRLTAVEIEMLTSQDGLDISIENLQFLKDGTLAYKDSRVLLYIRDVTVYDGRETEPRFHLARCSTLVNMQQRKRFSARYVVSTRVDGQFRLNFIYNGSAETKVQKLSVCQNCLDKLNFNGFQANWTKERRKDAVGTFELQEFFKKYPRTLHLDKPKYNSDNAPLNDYTSDFSEVSAKAKTAVNWTCQRCNVDVSSKANRNNLLHVHHINSLKSDNNLDNLEVLCVRCHIAEHPHMKSNAAFSAALRELRS